MNPYATVAAAYFVVGLPVLVLIGLAFSVHRLLENLRANKTLRSTLEASAHPGQLVCRGGPLDGEYHDTVERWQCVEYPDSRGFAAVGSRTAHYLHQHGVVHWRGTYYNNGDHFDWQPMRSRFLNARRLWVVS